jgi:ABC-type transporter Mla subunit MlaD
MTTPGPPRDEYAELTARVRDARAAVDAATQRLNEAAGELRAYVTRAEAELTQEQRAEAEGLLASHSAHRRGFHPPPS